MSTALKAGGNFVVYTGKAQSASDAFASIMSYLAGVIYYWNNVTGLYEQVITTTLMVPYGCYWIEVTQDCTWTYGPDETAPTSVQLYARDAGNLVPYLGPAQPAQDAFASIVAYLTLYYYFNNVTKAWEFTPTMVPLGVYYVRVSQNCVWSFAPPVLKGTITKKELEYDESRAVIPASNIPKDKAGLVHIWGRNDSKETQQMGISWVITDPDGVTRESYSTWEAWPYTGAGGEHEFIGGRFSLDKVGTWVINVALYMNPSNPTIVDSYYGTLCSVIPAEPEVTEFKIQDYVKI